MSGSSENLSPQVIGRLIKELRKLTRKPPDGIKYIPNDDDKIGEIHAEIEGPPQTPYEGGAWRIKLVLGQDFPNSPPKGFFSFIGKKNEIYRKMANTIPHVITAYSH